MLVTIQTPELLMENSTEGKEKNEQSRGDIFMHR